MHSLLPSRRLLAASLTACLTMIGLVGLTGLAPAEAAGTYDVVATVPVGSFPNGVAVDPSTHAVYVANYFDDSVSVIDGATNTVTDTVSVGGNPYGVAVDPSTSTVYVASLNGNSVSVIDGATNTVTDTVMVGNGPYGVAVDPSTNTVYVASLNGNSVSVIDGATNTVTDTVMVGNGPNGVAVDPSTHAVYIANYYDNSVSVVDGVTNTVTDTVMVGNNPSGVAVDPSTHTVYVGNTSGGSVSVVDGATNSVTDTVPVGSVPYAVGVDPSTHTVYVANTNGDSVSVIDGATNSVTATVSVGSGPHGVAVDPSTHTAYVANSSDNSVSVIAEQLPGDDDATVSSLGELQALSTDCTGNSDDPTTITLAADINAAAAEVVVGCHVVLDLAGYDLAVHNVVINSNKALTIEDSGTGGSLVADASNPDTGVVAGIQNIEATLTVDGGTVTATGGGAAAGIGSTFYTHAGTTVVNGGSVTATGGIHAAGIGGGYGGNGGTTTVTGGTVTATGSDQAAGIGGGLYGVGGDTTVDGGTVTASGSYSAVGPGDGSASFGSLSVSGGVLRLPSGFLRVPDSAAGAEITIGPDGVVDGSVGPGATYADVTGAGEIDNGGRILLPTANVTGDGVTVEDRHYAVGFDTHGGSTAPDPVTVFADTFTNGDRAFPADPTKVGAIFLGWNTAADGSGDPVTAITSLPGTSADGAPAQVTANAQWQLAPEVLGIAPSSGPLAGGTEVVITGTGFTGATQVTFGSTGPATGFTVDSDTQITAFSPASATSVVRNIRVTTQAGISPTVAAGKFTYGDVPAVTGIAPSSGPMEGGTEVVITGTGFTSATKVFFGLVGPATSFTVDSDTQITAFSPASATKVARDIRVRTRAGTSPAVNADRFTYTADPPAIAEVSPASGPLEGGTEVVITGTGFADASEVLFGLVGPATSFTVDSDTQITAYSPASPGRVTRNIRVRTPSGTSPTVPADRFTWR